jgi:hypothetical protein
VADYQPTPHVCQFCEKPLSDHGPACEKTEQPQPKPGCFTNIISRSDVQARM